MKEDLIVKDGVVIPEHELHIATSRAGGPGGQHVNKSNTRVTVRWNVQASSALTESQRALIIKKLHTRVTSEGDIIVHNGSSRSQLHNKKAALLELSQVIRKALHVQKKRLKTKVPAGAHQKRLHKKKSRSALKKERHINRYDE